jgi:hypothetical protein
VKPVRHHQLHAVLLGGPDHGETVFLTHGHRLLAQDMDARSRGTFRVLAMQVVWECDVDGVHVAAAKTLVVLIVGEP